MRTVASMLLPMLMLTPQAQAQGALGYWLFVGGTWKGSYADGADCHAAGTSSGRPYECRALGRAPQSAGGDWEADVTACRYISGADAFVNRPGEAQILGSVAARFNFNKCMTERGHVLK